MEGLSTSCGLSYNIHVGDWYKKHRSRRAGTLYVCAELTEGIFVESCVDSEDHFPSLLHLTLVVAQVLLTHTLEAHNVGLAGISWRLCVVNSHFAPIERESLQRLSLNEPKNSQASTLTNRSSLHEILNETQEQ